MSDPAISLEAVPVPPSMLEEHYRGVASVQATQVLQWRKMARRSHWRETTAWIMVVALGLMNVSLFPLKEFVPVFVFTNPDGINDTATAISDLPPSVQVAGIESLLWTYVRDREHYSASEADESYAIVSALSNDIVREQYQKWANPKLNRQSPAYKLGKTGFIRIYRIDSTWISHDPDYSAGVYRVKYCQATHLEGQGVIGQVKTVPVEYRLVSKIPLVQRVTSNPHGVVIVSYPGAEELGALKQVQLGSDNPCA